MPPSPRRAPPTPRRNPGRLVLISTFRRLSSRRAGTPGFRCFDCSRPPICKNRLAPTVVRGPRRSSGRLSRRVRPLFVAARRGRPRCTDQSGAGCVSDSVGSGATSAAIVHERSCRGLCTPQVPRLSYADRSAPAPVSFRRCDHSSRWDCALTMPQLWSATIPGLRHSRIVTKFTNGRDLLRRRRVAQSSCTGFLRSQEHAQFVFRAAGRVAILGNAPRGHISCSSMRDAARR